MMIKSWETATQGFKEVFIGSAYSWMNVLPTEEQIKIVAYLWGADIEKLKQLIDKTKWNQNIK